MQSQASVSFQNFCLICQNLDSDDLVIIKSLIKPVKDQSIKQFLTSKIFRLIIQKSFQKKYQNLNEKCQHHLLIKKLCQREHSPQIESDENFETENEINFKEHLKATEKAQVEFHTLSEYFQKVTNKVFIFKRNSTQSIRQVDDDEELFSESQNQPSFKNIQIQGNTQKNQELQQKYQILKDWFIQNLDNPYPSQTVRQELSAQTGLSQNQVQIWFNNTRQRYLDPLRQNYATKLEKEMKLNEKKRAMIEKKEEENENNDEQRSDKQHSQSNNRQNNPCNIRNKVQSCDQYLCTSENLAQQFLNPYISSAPQVMFQPVIIYYPIQRPIQLSHQYPIQNQQHYIQSQIDQFQQLEYMRRIHYQ